MKPAGTATGHEIHLHVRRPVPLVQIKLVGLNRHLFNVFNPSLHSRRSARTVAAKLHTAGTADHAIDVASLSDRWKAIPSTAAVIEIARVSRSQCTEYRQIPALKRKVFDCLHVNCGPNGTGGGFDDRGLIRVHLNRFVNSPHSEGCRDIRRLCRLHYYVSEHLSLETRLRYGEFVLSKGKVHEGVRSLLLSLTVSHVVRGQVAKFQLRALHYAAAGIEDGDAHCSLRPMLCPSAWDDAERKHNRQNGCNAPGKVRPISEKHFVLHRHPRDRCVVSRCIEPFITHRAIAVGPPH